MFPFSRLTQNVDTPAIPSENVTRFALQDVCMAEGIPGMEWVCLEKRQSVGFWGARNEEKLGWQWWLGAAFWHLSATTRAARRTLVWWHSIQRAHQTRTRTTTRVPLQLPPFVPSSHRSPCPDEPYEGHADPRALAFGFRMRGKMGATSCGTAKKKMCNSAYYS